MTFRVTKIELPQHPLVLSEIFIIPAEKDQILQLPFLPIPTTIAPVGDISGSPTP
jgi:hypothetical protein